MVHVRIYTLLSIAEDQIELLLVLNILRFVGGHVVCHHTSEPAAANPCWW